MEFIILYRFLHVQTQSCLLLFSVSEKYMSYMYGIFFPNTDVISFYPCCCFLFFSGSFQGIPFPNINVCFSAMPTYKWCINMRRRKKNSVEMEMETTTSNKINTSIHEYGCHKYDKHANLTTLILKHISLCTHTRNILKREMLASICANSWYQTATQTVQQLTTQ